MPPLGGRVEQLFSPTMLGSVNRRSRMAFYDRFEALSPRELSYHGMQLGVDVPEIIYPLGWGEWGVLNPGEELPFGARLASDG